MVLFMHMHASDHVLLACDQYSAFCDIGLGVCTKSWPHFSALGISGSHYIGSKMEFPFVCGNGNAEYEKYLSVLVQ